MPAYVLSIGTAVPTTVLPQPYVRDLLRGQPGVDRRTSRLVRAAFDASAIDTRHTVLAELARDGSQGAGFLDQSTGTLRPLSAGRRNSVYREAAPELFPAAAKQAQRPLRRRATWSPRG